MKIRNLSAVAVLLGLACAPLLAEATLGQAQVTVETDRLSFGAARRAADGASGNGVTGSEASGGGISGSGASNNVTSGGAAVAVRMGVVRPFSVQEMVLTDGTAVREYVDAA